MSQLRNVALTVHELEHGEFHWVLMEASDEEAVRVEGARPYLPMEASDDAYASYGNALIAGLAAMRRLFGREGPRA